MENQDLININTLCEKWNKLRGVLVSGNKVDYEFFKSTFNETVTILKNCYDDDSISKVYFELIICAYRFVHTDSLVVDAFSQATVVMTERMLHHFVLDSEKNSNEPRDGVFVYVLEERKQMYVDFNNIDESVRELQRVIERGF